MYLLINQDGHNRVRVVPQGCNVAQHLNRTLVRGNLMRSQQQRFPTSSRYRISHDVKQRPDAQYWRSSVREHSQICFYFSRARFHSDQRCSHIADAANEHIFGWVSSEVRQPARNPDGAKRCAILRLSLDRWMRFFGASGWPPGEHNTKAAQARASERSWRAEVHPRTAAICTVTQGV